MAFTVSVFTGTIPNSLGTTQYGSPVLQRGNTARTDVSITINSIVNNADGSGSIYLTIASTANDSTATTIQSDGGQTAITGTLPGFSLYTGRAVDTAKSVVFQMAFDSKDQLPASFQVQLGAKPGGATPNSGYTFSKTRIMEDAV